MHTESKAGDSSDAARAHGAAGRLVVVGVGGAGVNAVAHLADHGLGGVRLVAMDTSAQSLARAAAARRVLLGGAARGLGTGGRSATGLAAARAALDAIREAVAGADVALVVAGLAGGTGGGAAPEVARAARSEGVVAMGFGIEPFAFENGARRRAADAARSALAAACDATVCLETARAEVVAADALPLDVALRVADDVLRQAVEGLLALTAAPSWVDVGRATVRHVLTDAGPSCLALGLGRGGSPAEAAMRAALASPLADMRLLAEAGRAMVHVAGGRDLAVRDVEQALCLLRARLPVCCEVSVGCGLAPSLQGAAQVTLIASRGRSARQAAEGVGRGAEPRRERSHDAGHSALRSLWLGVPIREAV